MRRFVVPAVLALLLSLFWLILTERWFWHNGLIGFVLALIVLILTNQINKGEVIVSGRYRRPFLWVFLFYLLGQIYLAGFMTIKRIITGRFNIGLVEIETELDSNLAISVLASSITMTPGTVTIARKGNRLTILWIDRITADPNIAGPLIKKKLEKLLMPAKETRRRT